MENGLANPPTPEETPKEEESGEHDANAVNESESEHVDDKNYDGDFDGSEDSDAEEEVVTDEENDASSGLVSSFDSKSNEDLLANSRIITARRKFFMLVCIAAFYFFSGVVYSMIASFYPKEALAKGSTHTINGLIYATYPLVVMIMAPLLILLLPYVGIDFIVLLGICLVGASQFIFGFITEIPHGKMFIIFSFAIRAVTGIGIAAIQTAEITVVMTFFKENIGLALIVLESTLGIGRMVGPSIGGILYAIGGFKVPFFVVGVFVVILGVPIWVSVPRDTVPEPGEDYIGFRQLLKIPTTLLILSSVVIATTLETGYVPLLAFHLEKFSLTSLQTSLMFCIPPLVYIIMCPVYGALVRPEHYRVTMTLSLTLAGIGYLTLGPSPYFKEFIPSRLWIVGLSMGILALACVAVIVASLPEMILCAEERGFRHIATAFSTVSGLMTVANNLGAFLGPASSGILYQYVGFAMTGTMFAGISIIQAFLLVVFTEVEEQAK